MSPRTVKSEVAHIRRALFQNVSGKFRINHIAVGRGWPEEPRALCGAPSSDADQPASAFVLRKWMRADGAVFALCEECSKLGEIK